MAKSTKSLHVVLPSDEELLAVFDVNPKEFNKHVKALSKAAAKLNEMGFHVFGGDGAGRLVSDNEKDVVVAHLDGSYEGGVGDDLTDFESND
jgi:hypothetical protein